MGEGGCVVLDDCATLDLRSGSVGGVNVDGGSVSVEDFVWDTSLPRLPQPLHNAGCFAVPSYAAAVDTSSCVTQQHPCLLEQAPLCAEKNRGIPLLLRRTEAFLVTGVELQLYIMHNDSGHASNHDNDLKLAGRSFEFPIDQQFLAG